MIGDSQVSAIEDGSVWLGLDTTIKVQRWHILEENLMPIMLTAEILKKAGFKKAEDEKWVIGENPITLDFIMIVRWSSILQTFFYENGFHAIKYLHQLQNLYYSLTGIELKINLS